MDGSRIDHIRAEINDIGTLIRYPWLAGMAVDMKLLLDRLEGTQGDIGAAENEHRQLMESVHRLASAVRGMEERREELVQNVIEAQALADRQKTTATEARHRRMAAEHAQALREFDQELAEHRRLLKVMKSTADRDWGEIDAARRGVSGIEEWLGSLFEEPKVPEADEAHDDEGADAASGAEGEPDTFYRGGAGIALTANGRRPPRRVRKRVRRRR